MSTPKHTIDRGNGRKLSNRVRAVVTLSTGAQREYAGEWLDSWAHRSKYYETAKRADALVTEVKTSKETQVSWPELGVTIASIRVYVDERTTWTEHHNLSVATLHATFDAPLHARARVGADTTQNQKEDR